MVAGSVLSVAGLLVGLLSLALPWATYRVRGTALDTVPVAKDGTVAVFQVTGGAWYVLAVLVLGGLLAVAAFADGRARPVAAVAGATLGLLTSVLVAGVINQVLASSRGVIAAGFAELHVAAADGPGSRFGLVAGPLLGFGAALLALARKSAAEQA
jgi:hypothetical protein